jgi:hypothetical protein
MDMPAILKPNRCGLFIERTEGTKIVSVIFDEAHPEHLQEFTVRNFIDNLASSGLMVGVTRASREPGVMWILPEHTSNLEVQEELKKAGEKIGWQRQPTPMT